MSLGHVLALLLNVVGPFLAVVVAAAAAFAIRRGAQAVLESRHAGAAGPVWVLSAVVLCLAALVAAICALWTPSLWIDPAVWTWLKRLAVEGAVAATPFDYPTSATWLAGAIVVGAALYAGLALLFAWLIGPPPATMPKRPDPGVRRRGLPPPSAAASAHQPRAGLLTALDSATASGVVPWLYSHLGYWDDPRPGTEPRYRDWVEPLRSILSWLRWLSLPVAASGTVSALAWVAASLLHDALTQLLALPPVPPPHEDEAKEEPAEEPPPPPPESAESQLVLRLAQELGGSGLCIRPLGTSAAREARLGDERWPPASTGPLWTGVLDQWAGRPLQLDGGVPLRFSPYAHQLEAARFVLGGQDVVLATPPGSGRATIADLLAAYAALCDAGSVLVVVPNAEDAVARVEALRQLGRAGGWHWVIGVHDLATDGIGGLDPLVAQPAIVVGTVDSLERHFMAVSGHWDIFLATLSLVVVADVDHHTGARSASLGALCRRLLHLAGDLGAEPRVLATACGLWLDVPRLAEEVTGRSLVVVDPAADGTPRPAQPVYLASGLGEGFVDRLRGVIEGSGWDCVALRRDGRMVDRPPQPPEPPGEAEAETAPEPVKKRRLAVLAPVRASQLAPSLEELCHVPTGSSATDRVLVVRVHEAEHPLSVALFDASLTGNPAPAWLVDRAPTLASCWSGGVAGGGMNPTAASRALQRSLAEREASRDELEARHGAEATANELAVLGERGLLAERRAARPDEASGLPRPVTLYRLTDPARVRIASSASVVTSEPFDLLEASTRDRLLSVDAVRAPTALYPGCVFVAHDGRRYRLADDRGEDEIVAEPEPEQVWTLPVRHLALEPRGWAPQHARFSGTAELELGRGPVVARIAVVGSKRFGPRSELLDERTLQTPREAVYQARAVIVRFLPSEEGDGNGAAAHAVTHLVRAVLPAVVRATWLDLDVTPIPADERGAAGLAIVDLHPFGAGFADALRASQLRQLLVAALALAVELPAAAGPASPCCSPAGAWPGPDPKAATKLLRGLLGD